MTNTFEERKRKAEAMATRFMDFAAFESEYGKAAGKGHKLVMAQAEAKAVERWRMALRMSLLCVDATDAAMAEFEQERKERESGGDAVEG